MLRGGVRRRCSRRGHGCTQSTMHKCRRANAARRAFSKATHAAAGDVRWRPASDYRTCSVVRARGPPRSPVAGDVRVHGLVQHACVALDHARGGVCESDRERARAKEGKKGGERERARLRMREGESARATKRDGQRRRRRGAEGSAVPVHLTLCCAHMCDAGIPRTRRPRSSRLRASRRRTFMYG